MKAKKLNERAEKELLRRQKTNKTIPTPSSKIDIDLVIHDLQVHQIELEMQNEELTKTQIELNKVKIRYFDLYNNAPVGYIVISENDNILEVNDTAANMLGYTRSEFINTKFSKYICTQFKDLYYLYHKSLLKNTKAVECTLKMTRYDNTTFWGHLKSNMGDDETEIQFRLILTDISEDVRKQQEIEYISNHDYLTKLGNRRYFFYHLNEFLKSKKFPLGIMMFDINGLKIINDAFGHLAGDEAIKKLSKILEDEFLKKGILSRFGGDEFGALVPNTTFNILQRIKSDIMERVSTQTLHNVELSLAVGYTIMNDENSSIEDSLKISENEMYRHKIVVGKSNRNRAINAILKTLTEKYSLEEKHSQRVSELSKLLGEKVGLMRSDEIRELELAGLFHDIGKISIPDSILNSPDELSVDEYNIIKTHTEVGYQILRAADEFSELAIHALYHHEKWDGSGYPTGLKGEAIPLFSRIISIADAYEAMTSDRTYRTKMSHEYAVTEIKRCSGTHFDPEIASTFIEKVLPKYIIKD